jgi:hypothetical protein
MNMSYTEAVESVTVPKDDQAYAQACAESWMTDKNQMDATIASNLQANEIDDAADQTVATPGAPPSTGSTDSTDQSATASTSPCDPNSTFYSTSAVSS